MSHYFRLEADSGGFYVEPGGRRAQRGVRGVACAISRRGPKALGYELIWSLSYELLDQHCWSDWKQRAADGSPALTGWEPPSALLSPAHAGAMGYLQAVALAFVAHRRRRRGWRCRFQIGEPWWWVDGRRAAVHP